MDIAIVAMDCLLPGADSAEAWIRASRAGTPALSEVPAGRWPLPPEDALDDRPGAADRTPTLTGGFVDDVAVAPVDGVPLDALDPLFRLVVRTTTRAAGATTLPTGRTDLLLANLSLPTSGAARAVAPAFAPHLRDLPWLRGGHPWDLGQSGLPALVAARSLDLGGHVAALDAACASGLYAVQLACERLAAGLCDAAIAAAVQRADSAFLFLGFAQLHALSPSGRARPFDVHADGLLVGEGAGAVVLKRLADAERDGDRVHAVLRGGGLGNDGRKGNLLAPSGAGQRRTLDLAHRQARLAPAEIGYVEAHATGTRLGDRTELAVLAELHADRRTPLVVSSTKGQIGHTITTAGLAGLIRAVGAVRDGFFPPTPGCDTPWDTIDGERLEVLQAARTWDTPARAAGVSAFGFGGTNAHVIVSNAGCATEAAPPPPVPLAIVGVGARVGDFPDASAACDALADARPTADGTRLPGVSLDPVARRIPPSEARQILPQQLAILEAAAEALAEARIDPARTASIVGMALDPRIAAHTLRWAATAPDAVAPPLSAARVQGVLPNFVANRIAATFDLAGPSYTVSAEALSAHVALEHAERLLASGAVDAVVVGASDCAGHGLVPPPVAEGAIAFVLRRLDDAKAEGRPIFATLTGPRTGPGTAPPPPHRDRVGHGHALDGALALLDALVRDRPDPVGVRVPGPLGRTGTVAVSAGPRLTPSPSSPPGPHAVSVPNEPLSAAPPPFLGRWGADRVPVPTPGTGPSARAVFPATRPTAAAPLVWRTRPPAPASKPPAPAPAPPAPAPAVPSRPASGPLPDPAGLAILAEGLAAAARATAAAHRVFLDHQARAAGHLDRVAATLDAAARLSPPEPPPPAPPTPAPAPPEPPTPAPAPPAAPTPAPAPPTERPDPGVVLDRAALEIFASGPISAALGPDYADLDAIEPRVRLPMGELLLVSRVTHVDGSRGPLRPARLKTEYDLPPDASWVHQGKPPPCVVVESGQADLLLCAILGTDAITRGRALYRLLDCDLTFHGDRPPVGETLCHDIRIKQWARLGETLLFYFEYDCTAKSDGRPVLTMREGCAGFFTPAELATPRGVDPTPRDLPRRAPLPPFLPGAPDRLDDDALDALVAGRVADAFGPAFAPADGAPLRLIGGRWRLLHRVTALSLSGPPHGLGRVVAEQDLADDDWFNPIHFKGDPCMPGTLMFDGCTQALTVWLLAHGVAAAYPDATVEPLPGTTARLRCRGQVVPGHRRLTYDVRVTDAGLEPTPWALADVVLFVDGTPVVVAEDVGLRISGERVPITAPSPGSPLVDEARLLEFSVGDPSRAFGPRWAPHDTGPRTPRMPGPPLLMLHRALDADATPNVLADGTTVRIAYDVPPDAWYFAASPGTSMPFAILLEIALQPCGWLTAYEGAALEAGGDVYFRNLGGTATQRAEVWPHTGTLTTTAHLRSVSRSGGMILVFFDFVTRAGDTVVLEGDTHFGYFTPGALADQKGLDLGDEDRRAALRTNHAVDEPIDGPVRGDLRMIDRLVARGPDFVAAEKRIDPREWFFTAHFHQDPVMPGSLGLEGLAQLARRVLEARVGPPAGHVQPVALGRPLTWRYRGQVTRDRACLSYELDIREVTGGATPEIVADGVVRADGLPIYALEGLTVRFDPAPPPRPAPPVPRPRPAAAALLDTFTVDGLTGTGTLRLDPARHPWLDDHRPTLVVPAVPLAFAAEIAAEAALQLHPGRRVIGVPELTADRWIHTADGPVDLLVTAVSNGREVAVTLAVHVDNPRFPALSGPKVHMRAVVALGDTYPPAPPAPPPLEGEPVDLSPRAYYDGGLTFHGPVLQPLTAFGTRTDRAITATLTPCPDGDLVPGGTFVLDPRLLDGATHPMWSGQPETWIPGLAPGRLAYPVRADGMAFHGPRPDGPVTCRLDLVDASPAHLVFDVRLTGPSGPWATFRWTETLVEGGPVLGASPDRIATFAKQRRPAPVHVGRPTDGGWEVRAEDLVEPLPGTLVRLLCTDDEVATWRRAADPRAWAVAHLAAKEAVRAHLRARLGRDVHPSRLRILQMRPDRFVVTDAFDLTAQEFIDHLGPTRFDLLVAADGKAARAGVRPRA